MAKFLIGTFLVICVGIIWFVGMPQNLTVAVTSDPTGAEVWVKDRKIGTTPINIQVVSGKIARFSVVGPRDEYGYSPYATHNHSQVFSEDSAISVWLDRVDFESQRQELMSSFLNHMSETLRDTSRESCSSAVRSSFPEAICYKTRSKSHNTFMQDWGAASGSFVVTPTPYSPWELNRHNDRLLQRTYYFGSMIAPLGFVINYQEYALQYIVLPQK